MATKKEIAVEINVDTAEATQSVRDLRKQFAEIEDSLFDMAGSGQRNTAEFRNAQKEAAKLKQEIDNINESLDTLKPQAVLGAFGGITTSLASGFAAAQGAAALFGSEGEELQKTLLKVQAASALAEGLNGLGGLKKSFDVLKVAILGNPLLMIAIIIAAIGTALFALKDKIGVIGDAFDAIGDAIGFVIDKAKEFLDWIGLTTFAVEEQAEATINAAKKVQEALTQRYDDEISLAKAAGENTFKLEQQKQVAILNSAKAQIEALKTVAKAQGEWTEEQLTQLNELGKVIHDASLAIKVNNATNEKEQTDELKKQHEERLKLLDEFNKRMFAYAEARADAYNKEADAYDAMIKRQKQARKDADEQGIKDAEEIANQMMAQNQREYMASLELNAIQNQGQLDAQLAFLTAQMDVELANTELTESEKLLIKEKYAAQETQLRMKQFDEQVEGYQQLVQATQVLTDMAFAHQLQQAQGNAQKERQIRKKQFQVNKAFGIANSVIDGVQAVQKALNNPYPLNIILAIASGLMATANTVKIASTKFDDGGGGSAGGAIGGNISMAGSGASVSPPSTGSTLLNSDGTIKKTGKAEPPMVKAIVTETDITNTQKRVNGIQETSQIK